MTIDFLPDLKIDLTVILNEGDYLQRQISAAIAARWGENFILSESEPLVKAIREILLARGYRVAYMTCFFSSQRPEINQSSYIRAYLKGRKNKIFVYSACLEPQVEDRYFDLEPIQVDFSLQCLGQDKFYEKGWKARYSDHVEYLAEKFLSFWQGTISKLIRRT